MLRNSARRVAVYDYEPATETMRDDVLRGLSRDPKELPSQYLYDTRGAQLFEHICNTDEYYVTRTELAILRSAMDAIAARIGPRARLIEPGSGSGVKTRMLLEGLTDPAGYVPIDVARDQLERSATKVAREFPDIGVTPVCADFTNHDELPRCDTPAESSVCYFPGSTIGNFKPNAAVALLRRMGDLCADGGGVLIGVDLKKDREILEAAYNDEAGFSREFALNYLVRLNRELEADFRLDQFDYEAPYNESLGRIEMALLSLSDQVVSIDGTSVRFRDRERISTEYSHKFTLREFASLAEKARLRVEQIWTDSEELFSVQYLTPR